MRLAAPKVGISKKCHAHFSFKPPFDTVPDDNFFVTSVLNRVPYALKIKTFKKILTLSFFCNERAHSPFYSHFSPKLSNDKILAVLTKTIT